MRGHMWLNKVASVLGPLGRIEETESGENAFEVQWSEAHPHFITVGSIFYGLFIYFHYIFCERTFWITNVDEHFTEFSTWSSPQMNHNIFSEYFNFISTLLKHYLMKVNIKLYSCTQLICYNPSLNSFYGVFFSRI